MISCENADNGIRFCDFPFGPLIVFLDITIKRNAQKTRTLEKAFLRTFAHSQTRT